MAAPNYTPVSLYYSTTASAVPTNSNLINGELAINITDKKLYAKDNTGAVFLLAANILPVANGGTGQTTYTNGQLLIGNSTGNTLSKSTLTAGSGITITNGAGSITIAATGGGSGTVTDVSVVAANGFNGTVATSTTTPAITLTTTVTGVLKGNGTAISAAAAGTDYAPATSGTSILYGNGSGGFSNVTIGSNLTFVGGTLDATGGGGGGGVSTFSAGTTGFTPSTATSGTVTLAGTLNVANGGTGVTASSGANSVVLRDANQNIVANSFFNSLSSVTASGTPIVLTVASAPVYLVTGSGGQVFQLPDATTLSNGTIFSFNNNQSSGAITVNNNSGTLIVSVPSGGYVTVILLTNTIAAGTWDRHDQAPSNTSWSTNTLDYPGSITNATWNGNVVQYNRGGTGQSSYATGDIIYASAANTLSKLTAGTNGYVLTLAGGVPTWAAGGGGGVTTFDAGTTGFTPSTATSGAVTLSGTLNVANGGTGSTTGPIAISNLSGVNIETTTTTVGMTTSSPIYQIWNPTATASNKVYNLPDPSTISVGYFAIFTNRNGGGGQMQIRTFANNSILSVNTYQIIKLTYSSVGTAAANWFYEYLGSRNATGSGNLVYASNPAIDLTSSSGLPLTTGVTGELPIANGGTGQATKTLGFNALSPTTTKGDLIVSNGTDNVRQAVGTDTFVLTADSTTATGVKWGSITLPSLLRVLASTANVAQPTLNTDSYDMMVITGQSVAITSFTANLTGTPVNGQRLWIAITGTAAIAITWGSSFESSTSTLPNTTVTTNRLDIGFVWNAATSKWRCVSQA